jgi:hypothetical protein
MCLLSLRQEAPAIVVTLPPSLITSKASKSVVPKCQKQYLNFLQSLYNLQFYSRLLDQHLKL